MRTGFIICGFVGLAASSTSHAEESPGGAGSLSLDEIIVTAQKREERLTDVPISITALSSKQLEEAGIYNLGDIAKLTPGLVMQSNGGYAQPAIRGVSSTGSNPGDASNVAVYIDGVYQGSQGTQLYDLPDVAQIEVLKGPQGTLFGQNAAGGAIVITTLAPSFTPTGKVSVTFGNLNERIVNGYFSAPIADTLAFSISGGIERRDGYDFNLVSQSDDYGIGSKTFRSKLLWRPQDGVALTLTGYWFHRLDTTLFNEQVINGDSLGYQFEPNAPRATRPWQVAQNSSFGSYPYSEFEGYGTSLRAVFDTGKGSLSMVTAYAFANPKGPSDYDEGPVLLGDVILGSPNRSFSEEITFASDHFGRFSFTSGLFYLDSVEKFQNLNFDFFGPYLTPFSEIINGTNRKDSFAVYGELTTDLTSQLSLVTGLRYSLETQLGSAGFGNAPEQNSPLGTQQFSKATPRVSLRYAIDHHNNVYFTYSQGFKSGVVDVENLSNPPTKPENVTAYEIGYKGTLWDRMSVNVAAFRSAYKDIQVQVATSPGIYAYENAASGLVKGFEGGMTFNATEHLSVGSTVSYLSSRYESYANATSQVPIPGGGNTTETVDASGNQMIRTPKWTESLYVNYKHPIPTGVLSGQVSVFHSDGFYYDAANLYKQPPNSNVDADIGYQPGTSKLRVSLWGSNLTNHAVPFAFQADAFATSWSFSPPRMYGLKATYDF